jgi:hypothetical protein
VVARNDAERRALNEALKDGDLWAEKERWLPVVEETRRRLSTKGVERPAGLAGGALVVSYYMLACSGLVKWTVRYEIGSQWIVIGWFVTEYLPEDARRMQVRPITTHGKTVVVNHKVSGELERRVRVLVDGEGLPVPVPEQLWALYGLDG